MATSITVPRLGWSMNEGTFVGWLKMDGEAVKAGEPLFTLEGDKASQEVEATDTGVLRIPPGSPKPGSTVSVGVLLGYLVGEDETCPTPPPAQRSETVHLASSLPSHVGENAGKAREGTGDYPGEPSASVSVVTISPRARRRAAELGLDYRHLKGSGRSGRIIEADVLAASQHLPGPGMSTMRRVIAQRTAESFARAPHFYLRTEVDATALLELRDRLLPKIEQGTGIRLTLTDLLLRAQALALRGCPHANAIWQGGGVERIQACDVGLVVGLAGGLRVPIVRGPDQGSMASLVKQRASLVEAARAGKLTPESMLGAATSLSNLGKTCVDEFSAVISPPHSSMLAVGRAAPRPFVFEGHLAIRATLILCLSVDHRVMDGGPASQFLGRIVDLIERPAELAREEWVGPAAE